MRRHVFALIVVAFLALPVRAESPGVFALEAKAPLDDVYKGVYKAFDKAGWYVAFEMDMFKGMSSSLPRKLGEDFNRAGLEGIRTMVFCQGVHANAIMNADPEMMALCPLHLTIIHKAGITKVLFARPSAVAKGSPAEAPVKAVEDEVIGIIRAGVGS